MIITVTWVVVVTVALVLYLRQQYTTLSKAGLNHLPILPFFGHMYKTFFNLENITDVLMRNVSAFPDDKVIGQYEMVSPVYLVKDVETIKKVTIKDFEYFVDRRSFATDVDPIFGRNLLNLKGDHWKEMRSALSPAFTSSKIRLMVPFMVEVGEQMNKVLHTRIKDSDNEYIDLELKNLSTRYANDVIASCAFGLKVESQAVDNHFYVKSKELTNLNFLKMLKVFFLRCFPAAGNVLKLNLSKPEICNFYKNLVLNTMQDREKNNIIRHDMINLLNEFRKGKLSHEKEVDADAGFATVEESAIGKKQYNKEWTDDELVAQAVIFLFAGFDTVSTAMTFILFELAAHPEIQDKLAKEIKEHDAQNNGKFDFNSIQTMKYLDMVVSEGLRLYPAAAYVDRMCVKDYNFGKVNKTANKDLIVHKGDIIGFPIWTFHRDPKLFPDPLKFDPERFSDENKHNIKPFSYMPFGLGPRNCIGSRFALCEVKVMLYQLLREMKVTPCEKTVHPAKLVGGFTIGVKNGAWVRVQVRNDERLIIKELL